MRGYRWPMALVIETVGLTKVYGATRAVSDLELAVGAGQVFGYLGPNGAGKTTTIRLLLALQRPTSGRAQVLGLDCQADQVEIHRRVGYLPGELELYPRMTGRQHLDWFGRMRGVTDRSVTDELVERFQVVLDRPSAELSKGNRQKVGLVMALMHKPDLLVLDEPTSGLDPLMQREFEAVVRGIVAEGGTVFLSSHELDEVQRLADRVAIIRSGTLVATDTVERLRQNAPRWIEVRFRDPVSPSLFAGIGGVVVVAADGSQLSLRASGPIAPLLRVIAERDPVDLVVRHADLDELFLEFYGDSDAQEPGARPDHST